MSSFVFPKLRGPRLRLAAAGALVGGGIALAHPAPASDLGTLAGALGDAVHAHVAPEDIRWETSRGAATDATAGRFVLFLAAETAGAPRDVWRARVRVTPEGKPLEVVGAHDLTSTPLGDDHALVVRDRYAAFATFAFGQEQSVTLLDLAGEGDENVTRGAADRAMSYLTNVQQTGSGEGIGRVDVTLDRPARAIGLSIGASALAIDLAYEAGGAPRRALVDLAKGEVVVAPDGALHAQPARHLAKPLVHWAVDTVRAVPWIGTAPIAWLEERAFAARDAWKRLAFKLHHGSDDATDTLAATTVDATEPVRVLDASGADADAQATEWPPPSLATIWKTPEPGEGTWVAPHLPVVGAAGAKKDDAPSPSPNKAARWIGANAPPAFYRTFVRPDEQRPYAHVLLVAMDMRQLDLGMEAGVEDPKPLTGNHGNGRIPRDPAIATRVVAAFNGAFKTEHGNYGMMVNRRVLLPPQPAAATVIVTKDARVGMGTWGATHDVTGVHGVADADIVSFRQNLDPLIDGGRLNPTGRTLWGYTLPGNGMQTERSGMCVTGAGHLVYAWGDDVSATTLAKAMKMAGCAYGMHLDMNPHHTGFLFTSIRDLKARQYRSEVLSPLMEISTDRYIEYASKDFFYMMAHDPSPPALGGAVAGTPAAEWRVDAGVQPAPAWMPGIWGARADEAGTAVDLFDVEAGRAAWRIRAGTKEPDPRTGQTPLHDLSEEDAHRVLFAVGLGASTEKHPRGLVTDGRVVARVGAAGAALVAIDGGLAIVKAGEAAASLFAGVAHADAAEVPLVVDDGVVTAAAHAGAGGSGNAGVHGSHGVGAALGPGAAGATDVRAALGTTPDGRVIVARGDVATFAPLAAALVRAGCTRAVALDRGVHARATLDRAGTPAPPRARYDETVLYGLAVPMRARGFRFDAEAPAVAAQAVR